MTKKKLVEFIVSIEDPIGIGDDEYRNKIMEFIQQFELETKEDLSDRVLQVLLENNVIKSSVEWNPIRAVIFKDWV
jgi:hypothetical protein